MLTVITGWAGRNGKGNAFCRAVAALAVALLLTLMVIPGSASAASNPPLAWSTAQQLEHAPFASGTSINSVSCPSVTLCVAGDADGNVLTSSDPAGGGTAWHATPVAPGHSVSAIDCPAAGFCVALTAGGIYVSASPAAGSKAWTRSTTKTTGPFLACAGSELCVAGGTAGDLIASTNPGSASATWRAFTIDGGTAITGLSCPSVILCVATDGNGNVLTSSNPAGGASAWVAADVDGVAGIANVSCPTTSFCLAEDSLNRVIYSTSPAGGTADWHTANVPWTSSLPVLTCSSATLCAGVDADGDVFVSTNPTGGSSTWQLSYDESATAIPAISCPTASLCVAVDPHGDAISSTDPTAASPVWSSVNIDGTTGIGDIDCPSAGFCAATDGRDILTSDDPAGGRATWTTTDVAGAGDIDCASASFCVASGNSSVLWSTDPSGGTSAWHVTNLSAAYPDMSLATVACPTTSMCVIGAQDGILGSTDPTGGSSAWQFTELPLPPHWVLDQLSCPSSQLCVGAVGVSGPLYLPSTTFLTSTDPTGGASAWTTASLSQPVVSDLSCPSVSLCLAGGTYINSQSQSAQMQLTSTDPTGGSAAWKLADSAHPVDGIACPTASECFAFPSAGNQMLTSTDPAGGPSTWKESAGPAQYSTVSCPATTLCVAANTKYGYVQVGTPPVSTTTQLTSAPASAITGQPLEVGVRVTSAQAGQGAASPSGTVTVRAGTRTCTAALKGSAGVSSGSCKITEPGPGRYHVSASYAAQGSFAGSTTVTSRLLTVRKAEARARLRLSSPSVRYGHEQRERLSVTITPQYSGTPGGKVVIVAGSKTVCALRLKAGRASCTPSARKLRRGTYRLRARYGGNGAFRSAISPPVRLRVTG
jgi:hypothetical protein